MAVLVTGATGFLGRRVVQELLNHQYEVRCLVHTPGRERIFADRSVDVQYGNVLDADALASACQGMESVIHTVAIIRQRRGATFDQINRQGTANLVAAAKEAGGVRHFIHISALGASNTPGYRYLYSKWQGEREVIDSGLSYTIFRPSLIFGEGDEFLNALAGLVRVFPLSINSRKGDAHACLDAPTLAFSSDSGRYIHPSHWLWRGGYLDAAACPYSLPRGFNPPGFRGDGTARNQRDVGLELS